MCKLYRKWERAAEELDMLSSLRMEVSLTGQCMDDIRKLMCSGHRWTRCDPLLFFLSHCFRVRQMWYTFFALLIFFTLGNFLAFLFSGLVKPCLLPVSEVNEVMFSPGPAFGRMQPCFTDQHMLKNETWAWKHAKAFPGWSQGSWLWLVGFCCPCYSSGLGSVYMLFHLFCPLELFLNSIESKSNYNNPSRHCSSQ